jgi:hypothetical protein
MASHGPPRGEAAPVRSGWLTFAGVIALTVGAFNLIDGIVALLEEEYFLVDANRILVFGFGFWGWFWVVVGVVQIAVGVGVLAGRTWARVAGVVFAMLAAIGQLAFLAAFPVWSALVIGLCVLLMFALTAPPAAAEPERLGRPLI